MASSRTKKSPKDIKQTYDSLTIAAGDSVPYGHITATREPGNSQTVFCENPIQNLIQIYEGRQAREGPRQQSPGSVTKGKASFLQGEEREEEVTNSVDEFMALASKAQSKYQQMLVTPPSSPHPSQPSSNHSSPHSHTVVQTPPTDTEIQNGCFTDVSIAGSFAGSHSPVEDERRRGGKKKSEDSPGINSGTFTEISYAGSFASNGSKSSSSSCSPVQSEKPPPPLVPKRGAVPVPPSPMMRKRQRREQLLQEHKTLGREIVLTALREEDKGEHKYGERKLEKSREGGRMLEEKKGGEKQLKKMLDEREEEIKTLRAACEGWRGKTLDVERELSEAHFTVDKLERLGLRVNITVSSSLHGVLKHVILFINDNI